MDIYLIIFVSALVLVFFGTIVANICLNRKRVNEKAQHFSKEKLTEYEKMVTDFLKEKAISEGTDISTIVEKLGYELAEKKLKRDHEAEKSGCTIYYDPVLSYRDRNFAIAHEVAHIIRGDKEAVARDTHSFRVRSVTEQICDYIAAAILLPLEEMKKYIQEVDISDRDSKEYKSFVARIAEEKNISKEVVIRRISEVELLAE